MADPASSNDPPTMRNLPFRRREAALPLLAASVGALAMLAAGADARAMDIGGSAALTSDYVFRGISQAQGDPAAQFGVKVAAGNGVYGSAWGSTVEFPGDAGASTELDAIVGWSGRLARDWALDVNATQFGYPAARTDLAYTELIGTLTWRDDYWLMAGYSPDVFATGHNGFYVQVGAKVPFGERFRLEAAVAHYELDDAYGRSYSHASFGAVWALRAPDAKPGLELRVTAHGTDAGARDLFPGLAGSRVEAALQAAF